MRAALQRPWFLLLLAAYVPLTLGGGEVPLSIAGINAAQDFVPAVLMKGGRVLIPRGDHFCADFQVLQVGTWLEANCEYSQREHEHEGTPVPGIKTHAPGALREEQTTRVWGRWDLRPGSSGRLKRVGLCWETVGGFGATLCISGGPWNLEGCGVTCGSGACVEASDGAVLESFETRFGGFGYGPRPSASVGIVAYSLSDKGCEVKLTKCMFCNTISHAARFQVGAMGHVVACTLQNCGKGLAASKQAKLTVRNELISAAKGDGTVRIDRTRAQGSHAVAGEYGHALEETKESDDVHVESYEEGTRVDKQGEYCDEGGEDSESQVHCQLLSSAQDGQTSSTGPPFVK